MAEANGQASEGTGTTQTGTQTTGAAPGSESASAQTTANGTVAAEETFFDPESIKGKPELEAAYKEMQRAFTKRTTALKGSEQKIQAYDQFMSDPINSIQQYAAQYGLTVSRAQAQQMLNDQNGQAKFEPQSWDDVISKAKGEAKKELLKDLAPFLNQVQETRKSQLEKTLDDNCPDWRTHEDKMMDNLKLHPTLVNDPIMLYRLSLPPEALESRATQAALKKLQDKASSAQLSGGSTTTQPASIKPKGKMSFNEAVEFAKADLAAKGLHPPTH